ncbi:seven-hairpin glycosidase [Fomitiporia mediterranea MF3/22]|uniref:seven-hairpin glycosidase n=1 Tax=Fomitiporia mediterranea (strain MF3/22) TaxID=694068 RepID=UPI0004409270|nr:seven-hairpin glycosidase [Fomitiporia mediterranea MF3/22]EJC99126.1 seven-hairpin glycosidase [Fomitiporia mediterranea MF3/22]
MTRARRFFSRHLSFHSKNRTTLIPFFILLLFAFYILWPFTASLRSALDTFPPTKEEIRRPDYSRWPREKRAEAVREAFVHAYGAYERYAIPNDELRPLRNSSVQNFNGWGVSMFDALDTLWLMDMRSEFERAVHFISKVEFRRHRAYDVMFFETVIRYLGGLLSAYALSGRQVLLDKADELGQKLLPSFNTETGMPAFEIDPDTGSIKLGPRDQNVVLAEIGSCQMEYKYLAHLTGNRKYYTLVDRTWDWFERNQLENGMWYTEWNVTTGQMSDNHLTIGALADSAYEYLLKQYLMSGKSEPRLRNMYIASMTGMIKNLLYLSPKRQILYVTDVFVRDGESEPEPSRKFEHLSCFLPGLLALGVKTLGNELPVTERVLHGWAAEGLAYSCWLMYADDPHGLAPEEALFEREDNGYTRVGGEWAPAEGVELRRDERWFDAYERWRIGGSRGKPPGIPIGDDKGVAKPMPHADSVRKEYFALKKKFLLRPETIESLHVMWRTTGDEVWRDRAWQIFLAIEENCRMPTGYASVTVDRRSPDRLFALDEMPSYALAETWKYLYLMFRDGYNNDSGNVDRGELIPMDKYVLNTEAHPFPIFEWTREEKEAFGIPR